MATREQVVVETDTGRLAGVRGDDGVVVFKGVPFAAPPVGPLRFRPAQPPRPWTGVRDAFEFAPLAVQPPPDGFGTIPGDPVDQSEDCSYLNLWTPGCDDERRPVMVFVHGGGFTSGSSSSTLYAGGPLASEGVVVVTIAYRLGVLGWLAHPDLADKEDPGAGFGNWGLTDQLAALEWVRAHAARFGGDPERITVFGESAGAMSVAALLAVGAPRGLFQRAILQSGAAVAHGEVTATRVAEAVAAELGLDGLGRAQLEAVPAGELLAAQMAVSARFESLGLAFQPAIDGGLLDRHPAASIAAGSAAGIDVLAGTNRDEWRLWTLGSPALAALDEARLTRLVARQIARAGLGDRLGAGETIEAFRHARSERGEDIAPGDLRCAIWTDWVFRLPALRLSAGHRGGLRSARTYLFDWESPFGNGVLGSCHALELPFVFGSLSNQYVALFSGGDEAAHELSRTMRRAWTAFAATGDPSQAGGPSWPTYDEAVRATLRLGPTVEVLRAPREPERSLLDRAFGAYGEHEQRVASLDDVAGDAAG